MSKLEIHLLLRVILILMTLPALFLFVSLTTDTAKVDKHLGECPLPSGTQIISDALSSLLA